MLLTSLRTAAAERTLLAPSSLAIRLETQPSPHLFQIPRQQSPVRLWRLARSANLSVLRHSSTLPPRKRAHRSRGSRARLYLGALAVPTPGGPRLPLLSVWARHCATSYHSSHSKRVRPQRCTAYTTRRPHTHSKHTRTRSTPPLSLLSPLFARCNALPPRRRLRSASHLQRHLQRVRRSRGAPPPPRRQRRPPADTNPRCPSPHTHLMCLPPPRSRSRMRSSTASPASGASSSGR